MKKMYIYRVWAYEFGCRKNITDFHTDREAAIKAAAPYITEVVEEYGYSKPETVIDFVRCEGAWEGTDYEFHTECCVLGVDE